MYIVFDVGNTNIVTSILDSDGIVKETFRNRTNDRITEDEFMGFFKSMMDIHNIEVKDIQGIMVSSVVPVITTMLQRFGKRYFDIEVFVVNIKKKVPFKFKRGIDGSGMGADRIINIVQALKEYPDKNLIIFDFGTATTYEVLKGDTYIGGGIFPGPRTYINSLFGTTARLPKVEFDEKTSVLGKNTVDGIQAATFFGYIGQVKYLIQKIKEEVGEECFVIATGGFSKVIGEYVNEIDKCSSKLSIRGIYTLYKMNINKKCKND